MENEDKTENQTKKAEQPKRRPTLKAFFTNMRVTMPLHRKLYLVFRNNLIKIVKRQNCCGHLGEPGC